MKKYLSKLTTMWIVLLVLMVCNLMSDDVRIRWNDRPESDNVLTYTIYVVQSGDSSNLNLIPVDTISDIWTGGLCEYIFDFDSTYIRAAVSAQNINGSGEISDTTRAYSWGELFVPGKAQMATIPILGN